VDNANGEYVSMGGRDAEMTFGLGKVEYSNLYVHDYEIYAVENGLAAATATGTAKELAAIADLANKASNAGTADEAAIIVEGAEYVVETDFNLDADATGFSDEADAATNLATEALDDGTDGDDRSQPGFTFTATASGQLAGTGQVAKTEGQLVYAATEGMLHTVDENGASATTGAPLTNLLTTEIENVQAKINTARVQAGIAVCGIGKCCELYHGSNGSV